MLRGTRLIIGEEAKEFQTTIQTLRDDMISKDFEEIIVPSIWEDETFTDKVGVENSNMMWRFKDKGDRNVCLIPEVTGLIQETWRNDWSKKCSSLNLFYAQRCYRYERPQEGRYREFTQFGIEMLSNNKDKNINNAELAKQYLCECLNLFGIQYDFYDVVKRGLSYYIEDGFEVKVEKLGAQKQIAGGGIYNEGVGWAIGVDRLILAQRK